MRYEEYLWFNSPKAQESTSKAFIQGLLLGFARKGDKDAFQTIIMKRGHVMNDQEVAKLLSDLPEWLELYRRLQRCSVVS